MAHRGTTPSVQERITFTTTSAGDAMRLPEKSPNGKGDAGSANGTGGPDAAYITVGANYLTASPDMDPAYDTTRQRSSVHIERPIYNQSQFDEGFEGRVRHVKSAKERFVGLSRKCACSGTCLKEKVLGFFPFIRIMRKYKLKTDFIGDLVAGMTVGIMQIPQGMAYAMLASVPAVVGLYVSFFPSIFYFFLGTSKQMSLGTFAVVDLMIGAAVDKQCISTQPPAVNESDNYTYSQTPDVAPYFTEDEMCQIGVATCVTFMAGVIQVLMGLLQLGFITNYLSEPLTRGFTTGCACHVFTSQIKSLFGLTIPRYNGAFKLIKTYIAVFKNIQFTNIAALILSAICIVILIVTKEFINPFFKRKLKAPFPIELLVVIGGTLASHYLNFEDTYNMKVVGNIPSGLPPPVLPAFEYIGSTITDAITIAIVAFAISVSMAKLFAKKHNYEIDANQELYAYGLTNVGSSFFHCFLAACSLSRSVVQDDVGGKTQLASVFAAGLIIIVLFFISALFQALPNCVLAAIILVALKGMFLQLKDLKRLWKVSIIDMIIWLVAFLATALLDVDIGLVVSIGFCLLTVVLRTQSPHVCLLGWVPQTDLYKDMEVYPVAKELPGIKIFRMEASLYFANAEYFLKKLYAKTGIDPRKLVILRQKKERATKKLQEKVEREMKDPSSASTMENSLESSLETSDEGCTFNSNLTSVRRIIIDCTTMGYIDSVGVSTLLQVVAEYKEAEIEIYLAGCKAGVREMLERCEFYDKTDKAILYVSVHDAVLGALSDQPELLIKPSEEKAKCALKTSFTNYHGSESLQNAANRGRGGVMRDYHKGSNRKRPYSQIRALFYKLESGRHRRQLDNEPDNTPLLNNTETMEEVPQPINHGSIYSVDRTSTKM